MRTDAGLSLTLLHVSRDPAKAGQGKAWNLRSAPRREQRAGRCGGVRWGPAIRGVWVAWETLSVLCFEYESFGSRTSRFFLSCDG